MPQIRRKEITNNTLPPFLEQSVTAEERLIAVYLLICELFPRIAGEAERFSPNQKPPSFSDEEVLTIYIFGILQRLFQVKDIHRYTHEHWCSWFPTLPKYEGYNHRLTRLASVLPHLLEHLQERLPEKNIVHEVMLIDSMPIMLARASRSESATVAREIADKGYCASKDMYYHGIKLHALLSRGKQCLPRLTACEFSKASEHDVRSIRRQLLHVQNCSVYADKAYFYHHLQSILEQRSITVYAVQPCGRGKEALRLFEQVRNTTISRMRQPIESWFSWLQRLTHIEQASTVRSTKGLLIHAFGRLTAALVALICNFNS